MNKISYRIGKQTYNFDTDLCIKENTLELELDICLFIVRNLPECYKGKYVCPEEVVFKDYTKMKQMKIDHYEMPIPTGVVSDMKETDILKNTDSYENN